MRPERGVLTEGVLAGHGVGARARQARGAGPAKHKLDGVGAQRLSVGGMERQHPGHGVGVMHVSLHRRCWRGGHKRCAEVMLELPPVHRGVLLLLCE